LSWPTLQQVLAASRQADVRQFFRRTWVPDEMFFQTLVAKLVTPEKISGSGLNFYHFIPQGTPLVFHNDQLGFLARQPHFFARKISPRARRLKDALDEVAEKRSQALPPRLPLQKQLGEYPLHIFRAKNPRPNRRLFGRTRQPPLGDLERNTAPYVVFARETSATELPAPDHLPINTLRFGELFAADRIDYGSGPQHPLYPAHSPALRDQAPASFLFDLIRTHEDATVAFDVVGPPPEPLAGILAEDRRGEILLPPLRTQQAAASAAYHPGDANAPRPRETGEASHPTESPSHSRSPSSAKARDQASGEILRFGNYLVCAGTLPVDLPEAARREDFHYRFPGLESHRIPDFAFHSVPLAPDITGTNEESATRMARFVHLSWFREAHDLSLGGGSPVTLEIQHFSPDSRPGTFKFDRFSGADGERFVAALRRLDGDDAWLCRLTLEIGALLDFDPAAQIAFSSEMLLRYPHAAQDFAPALPAGDVRMAQWLYLLAHHGVAKLPDGFGTVAYDPDGPLEPALLHPALVYANLHHIASMGHRDKAIALAAEALRLAGDDRGKIAATLRPLLPGDSRWWVSDVLTKKSLGTEQVADALNTCAAASLDADHKLAALLYDAALAVAPKAQSPALSSGWLALEHGDIAKAKKAFARVTRHYASSNFATPWPCIGGAPWPHAPLDSNFFQLPEGRKEWPRISVVTPSYNQGQYIEETILSVLNQNYPNLQYIVADGASTDGTREILERYRDRIDVLIIEPDEGQTQAINKGFRLADGDLLAWLNSDDMYAPGALYMAASSWMQANADVIAGICLEHADRKFATINKPAAKPEEFTVENLSLIFERWFQGDFFYQPEVFFTKSLLDRVGPLDETLNYAMDGELWVRFAENQARLSVSDWPFAFFRKHEGQKTYSPLPWLREQAAVVSRYRCAASPTSKQQRVQSRLEDLRRAPRVSFYCPRHSLGEELFNSLSGHLHRLFGDKISIQSYDQAEADALLFVPENENDWSRLAKRRHLSSNPLHVGWFQYQPNDPFLAYDAARALDIVLCPDDSAFGYLKGRDTLFGSQLI
jgi:hypothetical protein